MFHHHHQLWLTPKPPEESFHLCHWPSSIQNHLALTGLDYLNCCLALPRPQHLPMDCFPNPWSLFGIFFHGHSSHTQLWCSIPRWISPDVWHNLRGNQQALLQFDFLIYMIWYNIFEVKTIKKLYFTFNCHSLHLILDVFMSIIVSIQQTLHYLWNALKNVLVVFHRFFLFYIKYNISLYFSNFMYLEKKNHICFTELMWINEFLLFVSAL